MAIRVLLYALTVVDETGKCDLKASTIHKVVQHAPRYLRNGIAELEKFGVIARMNFTIYWMNPKYAQSVMLTHL